MHAGREAIAFMSAGMVLLFLAAAFFLTRVNIDIGKDVLDDTVTMTDNASAQAISESLNKIVNAPMSLPASGAYVMISYNEQHINSVTCYICNPTGQTADTLQNSCFKHHVTGDVQIWADSAGGDNKYNVHISSEMNTLVDGERKMTLTEAQKIVDTNKELISTVVCITDGQPYTDILRSCLFDQTHILTKYVNISATYNEGIQKYTIYVRE